MEEKIEFIYDKTTRRPKRLENNVFILYAPEKIQLQPGEFKEVKMKLKWRFSKNIVGTCVLLQTFSIHGLKLLNSNTIARSENNRILQNHLTREGDNDDLPPWFLSFELFNKNLNKIFQIRKKQEIGYFMIINDARKEIHHSFKREH